MTDVTAQIVQNSVTASIVQYSITVTMTGGGASYTAGSGIDITNSVISNTDKGSTAVATHESTYDHDLIATALQVETDPVFMASAAAGIVSQDIADWDTAYSWGNHAGLYDPLGSASGAVAAHELAYDHSLIATAVQSGDTAGGDLKGTYPNPEVDKVTLGQYFNFKSDYTPTETEPIGATFWGKDEKTLQFVVEGGTIDVNKELFDYYVDSVGDLAEGNIVSVVGITGNRQAVAKTDATNKNSATACIGMVTHVNADGTVRVTKKGRVRKLGTLGLTEGLPVYVNIATPGDYTQTTPAAPAYFIHVGIVEVANANNGVIDIDIQVSPALEDLSNVDGTAPTVTGQLLSWNNTTKVWDRATYNIVDYAKKSGTLATSAVLFADSQGRVSDDVNGFFFNSVLNYVGINTATPRRGLDSLRVGAPQMRLTYADNSLYSDFEVLSDGFPTFTWNGDKIFHNKGSATGRNIFLGRYAGNFAGANGYENVGVGEYALYSNTTGYANVSIGALALAFNTTGYANVALGSGAMNKNISGVANFGLGQGALNKNETGSNNIAIGASALETGNPISGNVAIGVTAGYALTGTDCTFIGDKAMINTTGSTRTVAIGAEVGGPGAGTQSQSVFIGNFAAYDQTSGTSNIAIGYNVRLSSATASQEMNIGKVVYGTGMYDTGAKIGIGYLHNAPSSTLDIAGDCEIGSTNFFYLGDPTTDGTWAIGRSGNNLVFQRRESGSYVTKNIMTA